jgi:hypothetical protein
MEQKRPKEDGRLQDETQKPSPCYVICHSGVAGQITPAQPAVTKPVPEIINLLPLFVRNCSIMIMEHNVLARLLTHSYKTATDISFPTEVV